MSMQTTLFGIPNCDTVKKARTWLTTQGIAHDFHDFKKQGLQAETLRAWLQHVRLDVLINRKGTSWRALSDAQKASASNTDNAIVLMLHNPSLIKRPVVQIQRGTDITHLSCGFQAAQFETLFPIPACARL